QRQVVILLVPVLMSKGATGFTGAGFVVLAATLSAMPDIPMAGLALLLGIDPFMQRGRGLTNYIGNGIAAIAIAGWEKDLDVAELNRRLDRGPDADFSAALGVPAAEATAASAGTAGTVALEEIVVTARKRSENLLDIPASIAAIPDTVIKEAHITQLDDIGGMVSNLNLFEAHDNSPAVTMRGVGAFEVVQGVGFYANDVQLFEGQTVRPNDIARIEVLKGPQGT